MAVSLQLCCRSSSSGLCLVASCAFKLLSLTFPDCFSGPDGPSVSSGYRICPTVSLASWQNWQCFQFLSLCCCPGISCQKVLQCHSSWFGTCPGNSCNIPWTWWLSPCNCAAVAPLQGSAWSLHVPSSCSPSHFQTVLAGLMGPPSHQVTGYVQQFL